MSGEMKFRHKKSANTFTLSSDGSIHPRDGDEWTEPVTDMKFVWISGGCYDIGCGNETNDCLPYETPKRRVCVDGFWMGKTEVTQGQWEKVMGDNPSEVNRGGKNPVQNISWNDAKTFIGKLNKNGKSYRLPTETEWEYACQSKEKSGLANMTNGVWEWCEDAYDSQAYSNPKWNNPLMEKGAARVIRGGVSRRFYPKKIRCTSRSSSLPKSPSKNIGFRIVANTSP